MNRVTQRNKNLIRLLSIKAELKMLLSSIQDERVTWNNTSKTHKRFGDWVKHLKGTIKSVALVIEQDCSERILICIRCEVNGYRSPNICIDDLVTGETVTKYGCDHQPFVSLEEWNAYCLAEMKRVSIISKDLNE